MTRNKMAARGAACCHGNTPSKIRGAGGGRVVGLRSLVHTRFLTAPPPLSNHSCSRKRDDKEKLIKMAFPVSLVIMRAHNIANSANPSITPRQTRRPRRFQIRLNLNSFTDEEVLQHFRLSKDSIRMLYEEIKLHIDRQTRRSHAICGRSKLLAVLHYLASGSFQYCIASKIGFTQPTFSRCLRQVVNAIVNISTNYIRFPYSISEREEVKLKFFQKYGMPLTIGLIDCTHIAIIPPAAEEQSYRNRKMFYSLNVQLICGPSGKILDVVARYPGGTHDSFVLSGRGIGQLFQSGYFGDDLLLGDNGYRLTPWLLTPYLSPTNRRPASL
ncbi:putative nuclease HARBI1 [Hyla sarda]|uniref:putative nuclease HARBI1 n=1 Tax=Hyla sarda TaxID=327740 RepID=UPI0024C2912F|nr:putative nuclease HARBI1 [Hyla sarda]